jgi:acetyl esterase/lipase
LAVVNALVSERTHMRTVDMRYGDTERQQLDVYGPHDGGGGRPVVLFFYGGSWRYGDRRQYRFLGEALASAGLVAVIADYRLFPEVCFPGFVHDGAAALRWIRENVGSYGGDPHNVYVMGHSAGGLIAALLALDPFYASGHGVPTQAIRGLIGLAGPYAIRPEEGAAFRDIFPQSTETERHRPVSVVTANAPPLFLAQGLDDDLVVPEHTEQLAARARAAGASVRVARYEGLGHIGIMAAMSRPFRRLAPVLADVASFIRETHPQGAFCYTDAKAQLRV